LNPPLTTIRVPAHALGWSAGHLLIQTLDDESLDLDHVVLETDLIVRRSCGKTMP
jgi:DNA-binding LacI/PurR family transcriptional regulator